MQKIIDTHTHIFPDKIAQRASDNVGNYYHLKMECDGTVKMLLEGSVGIEDEFFVISSAALKPENVFAGNDYLLNCASENKKFIPLCSIHPLFDSPHKELERVKLAGAKGLKLHPDFQAFNIDAPNMIEIYKIAASLELPILFHVGDQHSDSSSPTRLYNALNKVPNLKAIAAHMGGYLAWEEAEDVLYGTDIYFDTSDVLLILPPQKVVRLIRKHGVDKVLFGSDYPLRSTASAYKEFDKLCLNTDEKDMIYHKNAVKFYDLL